MSQLKGTGGDVAPGGALLAGGVGFALMSVGLGVVRSSSRVVTTALKRRLTSTLEVTSKDPAYPWVLNWLNKTATNTSFRHLSVNTSANGSFELVPSPGRHWAHYKGWPLLVERAREYGTVATGSGTPWERVTLTTFTSSALFQELLDDARVAALAEQDDDTTTLYTCWGTEWRPFGRPRSKRPLESVVLREGVSEYLSSDVEEWSASADWYRSRGVPYRRGYLLHGPPGGGKTSFVVSLAGYFHRDVCLLSLSDEGLTDDRLALAMAAVPPNAVVLLEDIDAAFGSRHTGRSLETRTPLTLGGLLNALDGAAASEGRLVFMTTNHAERLDPALLRPGRVDVVQLVDWADADQAARIYAKFYGLDANEEMAENFGRLAVDASRKRAGRPPSMAEIQAFLIARKRNPQQALEDHKQVADLALERHFSSAPQESHGDENEGGADHLAQGEEERVRQRRRPVKPLTALEVDRMVFNPQEGWEDMIGVIQDPRNKTS